MKVDSLFIHTTDDNSVLKILTEDRCLLPRKSKYLNENLVYLYYQKTLLGKCDEPKGLNYSSAICVNKSFFSDSTQFNLYPFDTGGVIARLGKNVSDIFPYSIKQILDMEKDLINKFENNYNYLRGNLVDSYINVDPYSWMHSDNKLRSTVDDRILSYELSYRKEIYVWDFNVITLPRDFFYKNDKLFRYLNRIGLDNLEFYPSFFDPIWLSKMKDDYIDQDKLEKQIMDSNDMAGISEFGDNLSIYIHNTYFGVSCFCSCLIEMDEKYYEVYYSFNQRKTRYLKLETIIQNRNTNLRIAEIVGEKKEKREINQLIATPSDIFKHIKKSEMSIYKVNTNLIFVGKIEILLYLIVYLIGTISDDLKTYEELVATIRMHSRENEIITSKIIKIINYNIVHIEDDYYPFGEIDFYNDILDEMDIFDDRKIISNAVLLINNKIVEITRETIYELKFRSLKKNKLQDDLAWEKKKRMQGDEDLQKESRMQEIIAWQEKVRFRNKAFLDLLINS